MGVADAQAVADARRTLADTAARLVAAGAPTEAVAAFEPATRRFGIPRKARLIPLGRVWRLGVLLLEEGGGVRATGRVTRAVPPGHPGHMAVSTEERREVRAAAHRGPFPAGSTVHYDAEPVELTPEALTGATGPLFLEDGRVQVRWSLSASAGRDLDAYLAEREALLLHPPQGAT
jgi:hypothetical protein